MKALFSILQMVFFFLLGAALATSFLICLFYLLFVARFQNKIYPGVRTGSFDLSELTLTSAQTLLATHAVPSATILVSSQTASFSATTSQLGLAPDTQLMASRAFSIGRQTTNPYYNFLQIVAAFSGKINLPWEISLDSGALNAKINPLASQVEKAPVDAVFEFNPTAGPDTKGRVQAFTPSHPGIQIDRESLKQQILLTARTTPNSPVWRYSLPLRPLPPQVSSSTADDLGIKDLLGSGESYFYDSIPGRVYNIHLGTSKVTGRLIAPGEIFSFNDSIGTISAIFGFQKAYAIIKGKTVLDDGGGVCQVSTTLYRAVLNAGLPVVERVAHAYRVGFYEEGGYLPGLDATVYPPSPDFRFKNDTGKTLLLQATFDETHSRLTFDIFGTGDGRHTTLTGPVIVSTTPPPDPITEDDPTLPLGQIKQVDTPHSGAKVYFKREVTRAGQVLISETITSSYIPWPARYLKGTKS